jgi:probable HAF family extracellular repeat protein
MKCSFTRLALCVWTAGTIHSLAPAAVLHGLGDLPGGSFYSVALGISADGDSVVGRSGVSDGFATFRWVRGNGMERLSTLSDGASNTRITAISADGSAIVGTGYRGRPRAFRFCAAEGIRWLHELSANGQISFAYDVSADGSVVVGRKCLSDRFEAFRWTAAEGLVGLGDLPGGDFQSAAFGVTADGSVVVGTANSSQGPEAFRWTQADGMLGLGDLPGGAWCSEARATSADGSVVVGHSSSAAGTQAFRWSRAEGMIGLGDLPGGRFESTALAVSADGSVIVGSSHSKDGTEAFLWTQAAGIRSLRTVLYQLGAHVAGWELVEATGLSADGNVIVGYGENASGCMEAWRADLDSDAAPTTNAPWELSRRAVVGPVLVIALVCGMAAWRWLRRGEIAPAGSTIRRPA